MRSIRTATALAALAFAPAALTAQQPFEGIVSYDAQIMGMDMDMVHYVSGDRVRQEMTMPGMGEMVMLMNMDSMQMTMIMPAQRAYMVQDLSQYAEMARQQQEESGEEPQIERTGEMETVAGHECENVTMTTVGGTVVMCIATDLGYYFMGGGGAGGGRMGGSPSPGGLNEQVEAKVREMFSDGFFPMKMTMSQNGQNVTMVVTSVERTSVSDEMFEVPEGYTRMPGMGGG